MAELQSDLTSDTNQKPELFANWTTPIAIPLGEPDIQHDDLTPSILDQAKSNGWTAAYYHFGKLEGDGADRFNPALIQREDGYWLLVRQSEPHPQGFTFGQNHVWAFKLDDTGKVPKMGIRLKWPVSEPQQHFEDPRGFYHPRLNQTLVGACTFLWHPDRSWTGAHQAFGAFDENWECKKMDYPQIGGNPGKMEKIADPKNYEKNWIWFIVDDKLHLLYKANPWMVFRFGDRWTQREKYELEGVTWPYGEIRGGTTPVLIGDLYFTFHHSSLPWRGRYRRYYAGAIGFEPFPPYKPKLITSEPLLQGSQNDLWQQRKPLVVFPCGALFINGNWLVSCGVNDIKAAWLELSHKSLLDRMVPVGDTGDEIFQKDGSNGTLSGDVRDSPSAVKLIEYAGQITPPAQILSGRDWEDGVRRDYGPALAKAEITLEKRRAALVKARAARQAKRLERIYKVSKSPMTFNHDPKDIVKPRKRRRRKLRKRPSAHARSIALQEHEATKNATV